MEQTIEEFAEDIQEFAIHAQKNDWDWDISGIYGPDGLWFSIYGGIFFGKREISSNQTEGNTGLFIGYGGDIHGLNASTEWLSPGLTPKQRAAVVRLANLLTDDAYEFDIQETGFGDSTLVYRVQGSTNWKIAYTPGGPCLVFPFRKDRKMIWTKTNSENGSKT